MDKKGAENIVVDHISRLTNESLIDTISINDSFTNEFLFSMYNMPWYANIIIILQYMRGMMLIFWLLLIMF